MTQFYKAVLFTDTDVSVFDSWDYLINPKLMAHSHIGNEYAERVAQLIYKNPMHLVWMGDSGCDLSSQRPIEQKLFDKAWEGGVRESRLPEWNMFNCSDRFLINHDKRLYFDCHGMLKDGRGSSIHPLPLLCSGGNCLHTDGDYYGTFLDRVGSWAFDLVSVEDEVPDGFENATVTFVEQNRF